MNGRDDCVYSLSRFLVVSGGGVVGRITVVSVGGGAASEQRRLEVEQLAHEVETGRGVRPASLDQRVGVVERQAHGRHEVGDRDADGPTDAGQTVHQHAALHAPRLVCSTATTRRIADSAPATPSTTTRRPVLAPAVVQERTQQTPSSRGVSLCTTLRRRRSTWPTIRKLVVIHTTVST